jgi:ABC-type multidrug transport system ATPase subunit
MSAETVTAIDVRGLELRIGKRRLLHPMTFTLARGKTLGVVGHNGAGKTTLFHALLGLKFPNGGEVRLFGRPQGDPRSRTGLGYVPERPYLNLDLQFSAFLRFHSALIGLPSDFMESEIVRVAEEVGLSAHLNQSFRTFSKGMLQKAVLAQASLGSPGLLILDEPLSGLDPESREAVKSRMQAWKQEGRTLVFSSHALEDVETLAQEVMVLKGGVMQFYGEIARWRDSR